MFAASCVCTEHINTAKKVMGGALAMMSGYPGEFVFFSVQDPSTFISGLFVFVHCRGSRRIQPLGRASSGGRQSNPQRSDVSDLPGDGGLETENDPKDVFAVYRFETTCKPLRQQYGLWGVQFSSDFVCFAHPLGHDHPTRRDQRVEVL